MSSRKNWYSLILNLPKFVIMRTCHPSSQSNRAATPPGPATQASTMFWIDVPCCIMQHFNTGEMPGSRRRNRSYTTTSAETSRTKARRPTGKPSLSRWLAVWSDVSREPTTASFAGCAEARRLATFCIYHSQVIRDNEICRSRQ